MVGGSGCGPVASDVEGCPAPAEGRAKPQPFCSALLFLAGSSPALFSCPFVSGTETRCLALV